MIAKPIYAWAVVQRPELDKCVVLIFHAQPIADSQRFSHVCGQWHKLFLHVSVWSKNSLVSDLLLDNVSMNFLCRAWHQSNRKGWSAIKDWQWRREQLDWVWNHLVCILSILLARSEMNFNLSLKFHITHVIAFMEIVEKSNCIEFSLVKLSF